MSLAWQKSRLLIPRWRAFGNALNTGELASPRNIKDRQPKSSAFLKRIENWRTYPSLISAAELVETAIVEGYEEEAFDAARRLVQIETSATVSIRAQAFYLLKRHKIGVDFPNLIAPVPSMATSKARGPIRANIFDAIAWLDLAFYQTMENHVDKAKRSMLVAMQLAPDNRFVLRCASRFFLHLNDPDRARDILIRSEGIKTDPWLMAAEISMSTIAGKGPKSAKGGTNLIEDGKFGHRHTTELAGALATLEIGGNRKKMRRLFQHSMKEPTGNSLAQAAWATPVVGMELVPPGFQVAGEHEAPAHLLFNEGKFDDSFVNSKLWVQDEPFATRPFEFTAATAGIVENFEEAIRYADDGFKLSPKSNRLMISKSFALACTGHTAEASQLISQIDRKIEKGVFGYFANANEGLIAFREGRLDDAKTLYHNAVRGFRLIDDLSYAAIAQSYMAREAFRAGDPEADNLLKQAKESVEKASKSKLALHSLNLALVDRGIAKTETTKEPEKLVWTTPNFSGLIETTPEQSEIHLKLTNN